jgi:DNA-binding NarL/FixJ family response regulator
VKAAFPQTSNRLSAGLALLIAVQAASAGVFLADVVADLRISDASAIGTHLWVELLATVSLAAALAVEVAFLRSILRRKALLERNLTEARTAVHHVIEAHFDGWGLTPAERDVATFLIKGLGVSEIAAMRGSAEGTVRAHLNAIYRKSGAHSRAEVLSLVIDSLVAAEAPAIDRAPTPS